jgi:aldose 1-epimerase
MIRIQNQKFGVLGDGSKINLYTLSNGEMTVSMTDLGCILTSLLLPSKSGAVDDLLLGFSTLEGWIDRNGPHFGSLIGRYANRIRNAAFTLEGKTCNLDKNFLGRHTLHGGVLGYDRLPWKSEIVSTKAGAGVRFTRLSPAGEQGFPGNLYLEALYLLNDDNSLILRYQATTDAPTPVNLTNHAYFNLKGHRGGSVAGHTARIDSGKRLEIDESLIPTGKILPVKDTVFDFSKEKPLGQDFGAPELALSNGGYDTCYCFESSKDNLPVRAQVTEAETGRILTVATDQPCMQLYTGNNLKPIAGKIGAVYEQYGAFCLETQQYTNSPNIPKFPQAILRPGETYESMTVYNFGVA